MLKITRFEFNIFAVNTFVVWDTETRQCMIVDPGMINEAENLTLDGFIAEQHLSVKYVVNTHLHLDHCFGDSHLSAKYGITPLAHPADHELGHHLRQQALLFGISNLEVASQERFEPLMPGDVLTLGSERIEVRGVPGHSPGGLVLYAPAEHWTIVGDAVFAGGGIGRTDLPGGDYDTLINAIRTQIATLPRQTTLYPGHGESFTL